MGYIHELNRTEMRLTILICHKKTKKKKKQKKKKKKIMDFHYVIHEKFNFDFEIGVSVGYLRINKP